MKRLAALLLLAGACRMTPPQATSIDADRAHVELAFLQHGRSLLVTKCGNCHRPPLPTDHTAFDWPKKLDEMSMRAGLDVEQRRAIETYLVTMAQK